MELRVVQSDPSPTSDLADADTTSSAKREQQDASADVHKVVGLGPVSDDDLFHWTAVLVGAAGTAYEDGQFKLDIRIPESYPLQPPTIKFVTKVCHPNVHWETGEICLDLLKTEWSPAWTLKSACLAIGVLLTAPEPSSPLNCDAANLLRCGDLRGYNALVRMYTSTLAMGFERRRDGGGGGGVGAGAPVF
ncbi:ubiquitin-conjugating enzyme/RWD-like protein [Zopfochytrium polystomum]|nr:ubiquitin-conjugating enzyme/RWD-like protein [Zopfochytrium polystomum]